MRVRLPLLSSVIASSERAATAPRGARRTLARAVSIADPAEPAQAAAFASRLAVELTERGALVRYCLLDYDELPTLPRAIADELARAGVEASEHRCNEEGELSPALSQPAERFLLLVGAPGIGSFAAPITVLTGTERPPRDWAPWLLAARAGVSLALCGAPPTLPPALARALLERGFLPRAR